MLKKLDYFALKIINALIVITGMGIVVCVSLQIVCRYVLTSPLIWTEEYSRLFFCWFSFIGCILGTRENSHLQVSYFFDKFPKTLHNIIAIIVRLSITVFCIFLTYYSFAQILSQRGVLSAATRTPLMAFTISLFLGSLMMSIYNIAHFVLEISGKEDVIDG